MTSESIPGTLPLAEALQAWSDPELLAAVEAAEAAFTPEHCDRYQGEWLAEIVHRRRRPKAKPRELVEPMHRALETAWYRLFVQFTRRVAVGEIVLWGRMKKPLARRHAESLPPAWADDMLLYPRRDSVIVREDVYIDVVAGGPNSAAVLDQQQSVTRTEAGSMQLAVALREWTNPALISEVCRLERGYTEFEMAGYPAHPLMSDPHDLAKPSNHRWMLGLPDFVQLSSACEAAEDDFRARLVRGEFHLKGVMAKPRREVQSDVLPGIWAADFAFDFQRDTVSFDDARYVAVTATYGAGATTAATDDDSKDSQQDRPDGRGAQMAINAPKQRPRGRKKARTVIEAALRVHWDALFPDGAPSAPGPWVVLARRLIKRAVAAGQGSGVRFPAEETVRKHLEEIYVQVLVEKGAAPQSDQ